MNIHESLAAAGRGPSTQQIQIALPTGGVLLITLAHFCQFLQIIISINLTKYFNCRRSNDPEKKRKLARQSAGKLF